MKKMITILVFLFSTAAVYAQNGTAEEYIPVDSGSYAYDTLPAHAFDYIFNHRYISTSFQQLGNRVTMNEDSTIEIEGDTIQCILALFQYLKKTQHDKDSTEAALSKVIHAGVMWLNQVPGIYKLSENNCKWPDYWRLLQVQGYSATPNTSSKKKYAGISTDCK